jgi:hypothetical protein
LCNQDKLLYKVFHENKKLNLELESAFSEVASLRSMHDDMSGSGSPVNVRIRVRRVLIRSFLAPTTTKRRKHSNQPKPTTHPIQSHPSTPREK